MCSKLDPEGRWIAQVFDRTSCIPRDGMFYIKDLRIFQDRSLANIIMIDNMPFSFVGQLDNGIYIPSYTGDERDNELFPIMQFLLTLKTVPDVRPLIAQFAGVHKLFDIYTTRQSASGQQEFMPESDDLDNERNSQPEEEDVGSELEPTS